MPRNGSSIYSIPPGTEGFPDTTIESEKYNSYIHDVETDLNTPRPIVAGGTGATTADGALANIGGEKSSQRVDNYDSHLFIPGSFYSIVGALGAPPAPAGQPATHAFTGYVTSSDPPADPPTNLNVVVNARDQNDTMVPGRMYVRERKAGVWGLWKLDGVSMYVQDTPPTDAPDKSLWWESDSGLLYLRYNDGAGAPQWVIACPQPDISVFALKADYATINSPTFTGDPKAPTPAATDNDTSIATTAFVSSAISAAAVRYDIAQTLTTPQLVQARTNIYAAPFDAMAYSGMQINGAFDVSQESGIVARGTTGYICDGWILTKTLGGAGVVAFSQFPSVGVYPNAMSNQLVGSVSTLQATLGATDVVSVSTRIEGYRVARLGWGGTGAQPITIGFWTGHAPAGLYSVSFHNAADNRTYVTTYTQTTANVLQYNVITIPGEPTGTWDVVNGVGLSIVFTFAAGVGSLQTSSTNQWLSGSAIAATGQINGLTGITNSFKLAQVAVIPGTQAPTAAQSPNIMRPFDQELAVCLRYFQSSWNHGTPTGPWAGGADQLVYNHPTGAFATTIVVSPKRTVPTLTVYDSGGNSGAISVYTTGWINGVVPNAAIVKDKSFHFQHSQAGAIFTNFGFKLDARL